MERPEWMSRVVVGSTIAPAYGDWRVVRKVCRDRQGAFHSVYVAIHRCSWTRRPYTILTVCDLLYRGFRLIECKPFPMKRWIDKELVRNMDDHRLETLHCCDVIGLP
jgi:hypothetical protein